MELELLKSLFSKNWWLSAAIVIGLVMRLLKEDVKGPSIPAKYRPLAVVVLGALAGVVNAVLTGQPWRMAFAQGCQAAVIAIVGHYFGVDLLLKGKELQIPGLMVKPEEKKEEDKPNV